MPWSRLSHLRSEHTGRMVEIKLQRKITSWVGNRLFYLFILPHRKYLSNAQETSGYAHIIRISHGSFWLKTRILLETAVGGFRILLILILSMKLRTLIIVFKYKILLPVIKTDHIAQSHCLRIIKIRQKIFSRQNSFNISGTTMLR